MCPRFIAGRSFLADTLYEVSLDVGENHWKLSGWSKHPMGEIELYPYGKDLYESNTKTVHGFYMYLISSLYVFYMFSMCFLHDL